ncbi:MAG: thrombospondin type 3 repeat-containing protein [Gammaproteobacteria bacterium]
MRLGSNSPNQNVDPINLLQTQFDVFFEANFSSDVDHDGTPDQLDNCSEVAHGDQTDTDGDGYGNLCDADFNNDCLINFLDFTELTSRFLSTTDPLQDLNSDGAVNFLDVLLFSDSFLSVPGPSGLEDSCN